MIILWLLLLLPLAVEVLGAILIPKLVVDGESRGHHAGEGDLFLWCPGQGNFFSRRGAAGAGGEEARLRSWWGGMRGAH